MRRAAPVLFIVISVSAVAAAALTDRFLAREIFQSHWPDLIRSKATIAHRLAWIMKLPGHFAFTLVVTAIVAVLHRSRWRIAALLPISGIIAGLLYSIVKWGVGRTRPYSPKTGPWVDAFHFQPFIHGVHGLFKAENLSFPSGHTCLAFASAATLSYFWPCYRTLFYLVAAATAFERVIEGAHYPSDVTAALPIGIVAAWLARQLCCRIWPEFRLQQRPLPGRNIG